jgi:RND family efflux transporter MFP subunit
MLTFPHDRLPSARFARVLALLLATAALGVGCGRSQGAAPGGPPMGDGGPLPVTLQVMAPKPVDRATEYVATLRSRRSSEIRPQVDGIVTRILVRSGDRVNAGAALAQIDPVKQEAAVSSDVASRAAQDARLNLARQELQRQQALYAQGLVSKQVLDQVQSAVETAEASLGALKAQEQESRVQLQYFRVTAPTDGVVGDIPVRVGDRVTTSTVLTTIDQNAGLEAYIYVPVERGPDLKPGLPVRIVDDQGGVLADLKVDFVSPQVDDRTQSILVKAEVPSNRGFRTEQFVRARVVWSAQPSLTLPALAVNRINGQYFAWVAEAGDKGFVARQRPVKLGDLVGNDYVVLDGLKPGERVVTSGIQKLAEGAPLAPAG